MSIYIIKSIEQSLNDTYIGSCKDFKKRKKEHKCDCYNENRPHHNYKLYKFIRANGGWDSFIMEQIDTCDVERLYQTEQEYIDKLKPTLNERRAYRTEQQKKEYNKEWSKEYREKNKDKISEKKKVKFTCECGSTLRREDKARHFRSNKHKSFIENKV